MHLSFKEIEHKFIVPDSFDRVGFFARIAANLKPLRTYEIVVKDTYYVVGSNPRQVYRYRFDQKLSQLTVKSLETSSVERTEINVTLDRSLGDQSSQIEAFLQTFGLRWQGGVTKDVAVAYFSDCEIVHYRASAGGRQLSCVEFEAVGAQDLDAALPVLDRYETVLGFKGLTREDRSLFEMMVLCDAPADIVAFFKKGL